MPGDAPACPPSADMKRDCRTQTRTPRGLVRTGQITGAESRDGTIRSCPQEPWSGLSQAVPGWCNLDQAGSRLFQAGSRLVQAGSRLVQPVWLPGGHAVAAWLLVQAFS